MPTVRIPAPLRSFTGGASVVVIEGGDLRTVLTGLEMAHPGLGDRIRDAGGDLRRFVNVFVGERDVRHLDGLDTVTVPSDVVSIVPAVAGG